MAFSARPPDPLGPLNPGNVVSAGLRLYRDRFKMYLKLAVVAYLWLLGGVLAWAVAIGALGGLLSLTGNDALQFLGFTLGFLIGVVPFLYGSARFFMLSAVMSRLAFQELINQPETAAAAQAEMRPKLWSFLLLSVLVLLVFIVAWTILSTVASLAALLVGFVSGGILTAIFGADIGTAIGITLGVIVFLALFLIGLVWMVSRLLLPEVALAVEPETTASDSIGRSWRLTQASVVRIQFVVVATFLITLPIVLITNYVPQLLIVGLESGSNAYWAIYGLSLILGFLGSMVVMPLGQTVKGVLYYDLRSRREGLDLQLRPADG
ncbi:MAG TPA: hypothetical protein V6D06_05980 [Trichocoleus sp.]